VQQPSAANEYTLIVEFDDSLPGGAADYTVDVTFLPTASASDAPVAPRDVLPARAESGHKGV
jgi:hypothetical protein